LYGLTSALQVPGQHVGVLALAGGYLPDDVKAACEGMGVTPPLLEDVLLLGGSLRSFGSDDRFDRELALDLQVLAGVLPGAHISVYFASTDTSNFAPALDQLLRQAQLPNVLSISWGTAEALWAASDIDAAQSKITTAVQRGITVLAAAGDAGATFSGQPTVCFPGSSPDVLCCGGTKIVLSPDGTSIVSETVWNDPAGSTGGGLSEHFRPPPSYQQTLQLPTPIGGRQTGRGVPDVAAAAADVPGYRIILKGQSLSTDGTSGATPLWAGLIALANAQRGYPKAPVHSYLYRHTELFKQVTGNNRINGVGYEAVPGAWNACVGLGVPHASALIESLATLV
jgi:kumamolisin